MSNIIEKLGITPGPWSSNFKKEDGSYFIEAKDFSLVAECFENKGFYTPYCGKTNTALLAAAPEMLEALIEQTIRIIRHSSGCSDPRVDPLWWVVEMNIPIIEKATGKSWEEIKELLK